MRLASTSTSLAIQPRRWISMSFSHNRGASGFSRIVAVACLCLTVAVSASTDVADAAKAKDAAAVKALLKSGADVNAAQGDGMTALHWAASNGDAAMVQMLLAAGANIRATTRL